MSSIAPQIGVDNFRTSVESGLACSVMPEDGLNSAMAVKSRYVPMSESLTLLRSLQEDSTMSVKFSRH
jgi:hypothetical protein